MPAFRATKKVIWACVAFLIPVLHPGQALADSGPELRRFQKSIVDRRGDLNPRFRKVPRRKTDHIIVHTSEGGLKSTLRVVSRGKVVKGKRITPGGHAHYVIARGGTTYRTLDKKYVADHAGASLWGGVFDISRVSLGIELVGYHSAGITSEQYRSLGLLLDLLQKIYRLDDRQVLTHSQVAYGRPNRWIREDHRGRKRCAQNFERSKAGLGATWDFDPDVRAGRLAADSALAEIYYGGRARAPGATASNLVSEGHSAWDIAGEDHDDATTLYRFPDGRLVPGDRIAGTVGWGGIPKGTAVLVNAGGRGPGVRDEDPVKTIEGGLTAWRLAGADYNKQTTIYIFPDGRIRTGRQISDWDDLPADTSVIVGYRGPYRIGRDTPPIRIATDRYDDRSTVYLFPDKVIRTGDSIDNFRSLPTGSRMFLPVDES